LLSENVVDTATFADSNAVLVARGSPVFVRALTDADVSWKVATLEEGWGATSIARLGELVDAAPLPGVVVVEDDDRVGLLTYREFAGEIEVVTIQALTEGRGVGKASPTKSMA
jgi:hypothetical protein